jgi:hypothetical protein
MIRYLLSWLLIICVSSCLGSGTSESNTLLFSIHQERGIYDLSDYGEPPQFAIWLENKSTGKVKTVFVTYRTATGDFEGKAECPVSLPAWIGVFRKETGRDDIPLRRNPADIAVTGATPKVPDFAAQVEVEPNSEWFYYLEVNVSGDYTREFPAYMPDGSMDREGNGQPSVIYRGEIEGVPGDQSIPELIGRTEQLFLKTDINPDLTGLGNAKEVFSKIVVTCLNEESTNKKLK